MRQYWDDILASVLYRARQHTDRATRSELNDLWQRRLDGSTKEHMGESLTRLPGASRDMVFSAGVISIALVGMILRITLDALAFHRIQNRWCFTAQGSQRKGGFWKNWGWFLVREIAHDLTLVFAPRSWSWRVFPRISTFVYEQKKCSVGWLGVRLVT